MAFVEGRLDTAVRESVEAHLDGCPDCRALLRSFVRAFPRADPSVPPESVVPSTPAEHDEPAQEPEPDRPLEAGDRLGRYVLLQKLGEGAMGVVWAAHDPKLGRDVALKSLKPDPAEPLEIASARLAREARAMAKLEHPNVLAVFDELREDGHDCVVMEWIHGPNLRTWLSEKPRTREEILRMFLAAGAGLAAAHTAGLVHRDFKPENVLVAPDGPKVCDFGLARNAASLLASRATGSGPGPGSQLTQPNAVVGTPAYMAPEMWADSHVDARVDQFSFCAALAEALVGEAAFEPHDDPEAQAVQFRERVRESPLPSWITRPLLRGLESNPEARYPTLQRLLDDLGPRPFVVRRKRELAAGLGLCLLVGVGMVGWRAYRSTAPCRNARHRVERAWSPTQSASIASAFARSGVPSATRLAEETSRTLSARFDGWTKAACAPKPSDDGTCMAWSFDRAEALAGLLSDADAISVRHALEAARALPDPSLCAPAAPTRSDESADESRKALARAVGWLDLGHPERALPLANRVSRESARADRTTLQARALLVAARVQLALTRDDAVTAKQLARQARWVARKSGSPRLKAEIGLFLLSLGQPSVQPEPAVQPERSAQRGVEGSADPSARDPPSHTAFHGDARRSDPSTPALRAYAQGEREGERGLLREVRRALHAAGNPPDLEARLDAVLSRSGGPPAH